MSGRRNGKVLTNIKRDRTGWKVFDRQMGDDWMGIPAGRYGSGARMLIKGVGGEVILLFYFFFYIKE